MTLPRRALLVLLALACVIAAAPAAADAAWRGSAGKIAYFERGGEMALKVFTPHLGPDSDVTVRQETFHFPEDVSTDTTPITAGFPSAPAWSPDGTRLAFAAKVPDTGIGNGATHTAIFVWTLNGETTMQITTPPAGRLDPNPDDQLQQGYQYTDYAPAWSPDGKTLAFVRLTSAGRDEPAYGSRGANVRTVSLTAGGSGELTHMYGEQLFTGLSWGGDPDGQTKLVGYHASESAGFRLLAIDPASGSTSAVLSGTDGALVADFDVTPDGLGVDYTEYGGTAYRKPFGGSRVALGALNGPSEVRSSPSGNGPLHIGFAPVPNFGQRGGIVERQAPDPGGDVWPEDPKDKWINELTSMHDGHIAFATPGRSLWDVQAQQLPIINIPGFAGSDIRCGDAELWPPTLTGNGTKLEQMMLAPDGKTNANCPAAGPTLDPDDDEGFVSSALTKAIYKPQEDFIEQIAGHEDRSWRFSWDWRKSPGESLARLDQLVKRALETKFAKDQGLTEVVMYGHSYGGLLMREYTDQHPEKVARVLTAGTPFWGAPKSLFFVTFGLENPIADLLDLDAVLPDDVAKVYAQNLTGAYHLFPSDNYGKWLRIGNALQDPAGTRWWFTNTAGANGGLIDQARAWHQAHDGFDTEKGMVETRAVIGTGLLAIGGVDIVSGPDAEGMAETRIWLVDGDVTVPARSATQGTPGTHAPLGDPVHIQSVCGVGHMALGGAPSVTEPYTEYLLNGRTPRKTEGACRPSGHMVQVKQLDMSPDRAGRGRADGDVDADAPTPEEAAQDGRIQYIEVPGSPTAIVDDRRPVSLTLSQPGQEVELVVTRYDGEEEKSVATYKPGEGEVVFTPGADGAVTVTVDGAPVAPEGDDPPAEDPPPAGQPGTPAPTPTPAAAPATPPSSSPAIVTPPAAKPAAKPAKRKACMKPKAKAKKGKKAKRGKCKPAKRKKAKRRG